MSSIIKIQGRVKYWYKVKMDNDQIRYLQIITKRAGKYHHEYTVFSGNKPTPSKKGDTCSHVMLNDQQDLIFCSLFEENGMIFLCLTEQASSNRNRNHKVMPLCHSSIQFRTTINLGTVERLPVGYEDEERIESQAGDDSLFLKFPDTNDNSFPFEKIKVSNIVDEVDALTQIEGIDLKITTDNKDDILFGVELFEDIENFFKENPPDEPPDDGSDSDEDDVWSEPSFMTNEHSTSTTLERVNYSLANSLRKKSNDECSGYLARSNSERQGQPKLRHSYELKIPIEMDLPHYDFNTTIEKSAMSQFLDELDKLPHHKRIWTYDFLREVVKVAASRFN